MRTKTTRLHGTEAAAAAVGAVRQPLPVAVAFLVGEAFLAEAGLPPDQEKHQDFIQGCFGRCVLCTSAVDMCLSRLDLGFT